MERAGVVGFMLVAVLFFTGLTNDFESLSGEGFDVPWAPRGGGPPPPVGSLVDDYVRLG